MRLLSRIKKKIFKATYRRRTLGPPTPGEQGLIEELRARIKELNELKDINDAAGAEKGALKPDNAWEEFRADLRRAILDDDPRDFTSWRTVKGTMFHEARPDEFEFLKALPDWDRWAKALAETEAGNPRPYWAFTKSSGNLVHQAYHLAQLYVRGGRPVDELKQIVEFGGGYGSMCRLIRRLGFKGRYVIFDLPEFSALQEYYLKSAGVKTELLRAPTDRSGNSTVLLTDLGELRRQLSCPERGYTFIATWSLSEAPLELRADVMELLDDVGQFLIGYQAEFSGIDNKDYFKGVVADRPSYTWSDHRLEHLKSENRYLVGVGRD